MRLKLMSSIIVMLLILVIASSSSQPQSESDCVDILEQVSLFDFQAVPADDEGVRTIRIVAASTARTFMTITNQSLDVSSAVDVYLIGPDDMATLVATLHSNNSVFVDAGTNSVELQTTAANAMGSYRLTTLLTEP